MLPEIPITHQKKQFIELLEKQLFNFLASFYSENTRKSYQTDLRQFIQFLLVIDINVTSHNQITEKIILIWNRYTEQELQKSSKENNVNKSLNRKLSALSSFFKYLQRKKITDKNPVLFIRRSRISREPKTEILTEEEVDNLLKYCEKKSQDLFQSQKPRTLWLLRYTAIATLLTVGLRIEELCSLKIKDIMQVGDDFRLSLITKGGEKHTPYIHIQTGQLLLDYIKHERTLGTPEDYLFVTGAQQQKINRSTVYRFFKKCVEEADIRKQISPHGCRATLASLLHRQNVPIKEIQDLLNHKNILTTSIYIRKFEDIKNAPSLKLNFFEE